MFSRTGAGACLIPLVSSNFPPGIPATTPHPEIMRFLFTALIMLAGFIGQAQQLPVPMCGQHHMTNDLLRQHPEMAQQAEEQEQRARKTLPRYIQSVRYKQAKRANGNTAPSYIIPVVVHVAHDNGPELTYTTPAQIDAAIALLNRDFRKRNADSSLINWRFAGLAADVDIEFRLAKKDPQGRCHPGYNYVQYANTAAGSEDVKNLIRWPRENYLNVWVVREIGSGAGGYAFLPQNAGNTNDGIVIRALQFGPNVFGGGTEGLAARSLTHEVGHYLGLRHTWGGSNNPGLASNCGAPGDGISDTPETIGAVAACDTLQSSCGPVANVENYMDYANCPRMFTIEQAAVMQNTLNTYSFRLSLWQPANLAATGVDGSLANCRPLLVFSQNFTEACTGQNLNYTATVAAGANDPTLVYTWEISGPENFTVSGDSVNFTVNTPGFYNIKLVAVNSQGRDSLVVPNAIRVRPNNAIVKAPITWPLNATPFSDDPALAGIVWDSRTSAAHGFRHATVGGNGVIELPLSQLSKEAVSYLISPQIDVSAFVGQTVPFYLYHRRAAIKQNNNGDGMMRVQVSTDCGATWRLVRIFNTTSANNFFTTNSTNLGNWVPQPTEWASDSMSLAPYRNAGRLMVRYEVSEVEFSQRLYLDDIRIGNSITSVSAWQSSLSGLQVRPNPGQGQGTVQLDLQQGASVNLQITDLLGRSIGHREMGNLPPGSHELDLQQLGGRLAPGIYLVSAQAGPQRLSTRLIVQ